MTPKVGDKVSVDHPKYAGRVWRVVSRGPANTVLEPENGGRRLRVPHAMITTPDASPRTAAPTTFFDPGELVKITAGKFVGLYVVLRDSGNDRVSIAKLGGDGGRYVRANRNGLRKVELAEALR